MGEAQSDFSPASVTDYWRAAGPDRWFKPDENFDRELRGRFLPAHEAAAAGALDSWQEDRAGALALLLLLDQFPRNMFRGTARAFATDARARDIARKALARGFDGKVEPALRGFFYLPLMHSEDVNDQERCLALYQAAGDAEGIKFAGIHLDAIRRFGRFPHRNRALGRESTPEEIAYLEGGGFSG